MNNIVKVSLIVIAVLVIGSGLFFAGGMAGSLWSQRMGQTAPVVANQRQANPGNNGNGPGNGSGNQDNQNNPGNVQPNGNDGRMPGQGGGRMGNRMGQGQDGGPNGMGPGRMNGNGMGPGDGMQGQTNITPLTADEAKKAAQDYITSLKIDGLEIGEVLTFDTHAYVVVKETATGNGAFELMIDPVNKVAHPEMGPASAWNLKYGGVLQTNMMGHNGHGFMGQGIASATATPAPNATVAPAATPADVSAEMPISAEQAIKDAQTYLDANYAGATAAATTTKFYGYYTVDFSKDGKLIGKLSVNGYNGQVFGHIWHGTLIEQPK